MRAVLKLAPYRRLLAAYALNELAWAFGSLALSVLVYRRTGSALGSTAFFLCTQFLPALAAPAAVARIERAHPRKSLSALYALEAALYLVLALVANHVPVVLVLLVATIDGIVAVTARSVARAATVSVTTAADLLPEGNAVANTMFSVTFMAGPVIAGLVVAAGTTIAALIVNAAIFAGMTVTLATAPKLPDPAPISTPEKGGRLGAAFAHVRQSTILRTLLTVQSLLLLFFTISIPVEVVYAQNTLHAGATGYGLLLSAWGGGAVAGSTLYAKWRRLPARRLITLGGVFLGVGFVIMALAPTIAVGIAGSVIAGVGNGVEIVAARTAVQERVEAVWMALVMSFTESLGMAIPGVGILIGGAVATLAGPRVALGLGGVGGLAVTAAAWLLLRAPASRPRPHIEHPAPESGH